MNCDANVSTWPDRRAGIVRRLLSLVAVGRSRYCGGLTAWRGRALLLVAIVVRRVWRSARAYEATGNCGAKFRELVERMHGYLECFGCTAVPATQLVLADSLCRMSSVSAFGQ